MSDRLMYRLLKTLSDKEMYESFMERVRIRHGEIVDALLAGYKDSKISIRISREFIDVLKKYCEITGKSMSEVFREIIVESPVLEKMIMVVLADEYISGDGQ